MRLARRVSNITSSVTLDITSKAKAMAAKGADVVSFGAGEPDFDTPSHIKDAGIKAIQSGFTKYTASSGTPDLREAISRKFKSDNGLDYMPQQIVVSGGAKHSLYNIFQAIIDDGDEVIIPSPFWLSYPEMVKLAGGIPVYADTKAENSFKATEKDITAKITKKTKALILNSPSNPTGCVYGKAELEMIARLAVKHKFFVISDEIYEKLIYDGKKHTSIASLGKDIYDLTLTVNGVSKSYSMTGWRIGYAAGPLNVMQAISNLQSHATSNATSFCQKATVEAISGDQKCIEDMRKAFEARRNLMVDMISKMKKITCVRPEGAFYVFCDISQLKMNSVTFATRLLDEANVAVIPGEPFGSPDSIRLSFATSEKNIDKGLSRIEEWIKKNG